jgi:dolichol-phosphate mannosyltransferase
VLTFIVPAYNEEQNLAKLFVAIETAARDAGKQYRVVVVNDGSRDGTVAMVERYARTMPLVLLSQPRNMGVGPAFDRGFRHALDDLEKDDLLVTMEADNTSDLGILPELFQLVESRGCDVALASCYAPGGAVVGAGYLRRMLSAVGNGLLRVTFPVSVRTWSSFYRVYRGEAIKACYDVYGSRLMEEAGFVCMVEMLLKMQALGLKMAEVPMVLRPQNRVGSSKMKVLRNIIDYFRIMYRYRIGDGRHIWSMHRP